MGKKANILILDIWHEPLVILSYAFFPHEIDALKRVGCDCRVRLKITFLGSVQKLNLGYWDYFKPLKMGPNSHEAFFVGKSGVNTKRAVLKG